MALMQQHLALIGQLINNLSGANSYKSTVELPAVPSAPDSESADLSKA